MVKPVVIFFFSCTLALIACSQQDTAAGKIPEIRLHTVHVGSSVVNLQQTVFESDAPFLLLQLHSNEVTAGETAKALAHREGIHFIQVLNNGNRLISFNLGARTFQFDPNRIFSDEGIRKTLTLTSHYTQASFEEVQQFRDTLLSLLEAGKPLVSVHNNTNGRFNILQYRNGGIGKVHVNEAQDPDDFFITNDEATFLLLMEENFNVVLEEALQMEDDGSLSLYCGRNGIRYINVEAEHGHLQQQAAMLALVAQILTGNKKAELTKKFWQQKP